MAKFFLLRLSLSIPTIGDLLKDTDRQQPDVTRTEFLREIFSQRQDFWYKHRQMTYVPSPDDVQGPDHFSGYIGKSIDGYVHAGPDEHFALTKSSRYEAAFIAIDLRPHSQLVAFEDIKEVGAPDKIIEAMFTWFVKKRKGTSWHADVEYKSSKKTFWQVAKANRGNITEIEFEFFPPNGLGGFDKFKEFDRQFKQEANAPISSYSIKNPDGNLDPNSKIVDEAINYASEGPGKIIMKNGTKVIFNSQKHREVIEVPEVIMPRRAESSKILGILASLFSRGG